MDTHLLLTSNNIADLGHAIENGYWDHSAFPTKAKIGSTILIKPNKQLMKLHPAAAKAIVKATIKSIKIAPTKISKDEWVSNDKPYKCRIEFELHTVDYTNTLDTVVIKAMAAGRVGPKGIKYFEY